MDNIITFLQDYIIYSLVIFIVLALANAILKYKNDTSIFIDVTGGLLSFFVFILEITIMVSILNRVDGWLRVLVFIIFVILILRGSFTWEVIFKKKDRG